MDDDIRAKINDAISRVIQEHENGFLLKWVALIESTDAEGERGVWTLASEGAKSWDVSGLLQYGLHIEQARVIRDKNNED